MYNASAGWRPTKAAAVSGCRIGAPQQELRDVKAIIGLCKPLVYTKPCLNTNADVRAKRRGDALSSR